MAGSRDFFDYSLCFTALNNILHPQDIGYPALCDAFEIISGHAKGADMMGEQYAASYGIPVKVFPADWDKYGKRAGMMRNHEMLCYATQFKHSCLVAFWDGVSHGTENMVKASLGTIDTYVVLMRPENYGLILSRKPGN